MPIYTYSCVSCDVKKEVLHSIKEIDQPTEQTEKETTCNICLYPMLRIPSLTVVLDQQDFRKMSPDQKKAHETKMRKRSKEDSKRQGIDEMKKTLGYNN